MNDQNLPMARDLPAGHHEARHAHLISEMAGVRRGTRSRHLLIGGLTTAGLATGIAAAVVLAPTAEIGGNAPPAQANAAEILNRAAKAASGQPDLSPRPNQYVYVESKSRQAGQPDSTGHRKVWLSADGRRAGLLVNQGDRSGGPPKIWLCDEPQDGSVKPRVDKLPPKVDLKNPPRGCEPTAPAYRKDLPTTAGAMLTWLYRNSQGGNPPDVQAFVTVGDTIRESYVPPASLSAMFTAAAKIPGTTITRNAVDSAGRRGIAVGQTWRGIRQELIFDGRTYRLLGERQIVSHDNTFQPAGGKKTGGSPSKPDPAMKEGTVLYSRAILRIAVTDKVGQAPTG